MSVMFRILHHCVFIKELHSTTPLQLLMWLTR